MNINGRRVLVVLASIIIFIVCVLYMFLEKYFRSIHFVNSLSDHAYLIDTTGCKIPSFDPFDPVIKYHIRKKSSFKCDKNKDLVYAQNQSIYINRQLVRRRLPSLKYCKYDVIWRPPNEIKDHNFYEFVNESEPFFTNISVKDEFVRVRCFSNRKKVIYTNVFSFIQIKPEVEKRCYEQRKKYSDNKVEELSILMLGMDSISRNNMIRYMPKTRSYLLDKMSAFELFGYNKVADNTFVNIVPMTTGKFAKELPWSEEMTNVTFENFDFIWKNFSERGYRTLYVEDAPNIQIFDYQKAGFGTYPTDYFNRVFSVAAEILPDVWNTGHNCLQGRAETYIMLNYLKQFANKFASSPTFSFTFISRLTHDILEDAGKADSIYLKFLMDLSTSNALNKTVVFFFSDHGIRFGKLRQTSIGRLEERLPFMFLIMPNWFLNKYPKIKTNLNTNRRRLTTPFDIYATLREILDFNPPIKTSYKKHRSISLFKEIPSDRTCEDAEILPHWCTCSEFENVSNTDENVLKIANMFVLRQNEIFRKFPQCSNISLVKVMDASKLVTSAKVLSYVKKLSEVNNKVEYGQTVSAYQDYQIILQTNPGQAIFEGTFRYNEEEKSLQIMGDISRINRYGDQSYCVQETNLKKFCYCIIQKPDKEKH